MAKPKMTVINFVIHPDLLRRIETFWHQQRFPSRAAAIKFLIGAALDAKLKPKEKS